VGWRAESGSTQSTRARHKTLSQVRAPRPSVDDEAIATERRPLTTEASQANASV